MTFSRLAILLTLLTVASAGPLIPSKAEQYLFSLQQYDSMMDDLIAKAGAIIVDNNTMSSFKEFFESLGTEIQSMAPFNDAGVKTFVDIWLTGIDNTKQVIAGSGVTLSKLAQTIREVIKNSEQAIFPILYYLDMPGNPQRILNDFSKFVNTTSLSLKFALVRTGFRVYFNKVNAILDNLIAKNNGTILGKDTIDSIKSNISKPNLFVDQNSFGKLSDSSPLPGVKDFVVALSPALKKLVEALADGNAVSANKFAKTLREMMKSFEKPLDLSLNHATIITENDQIDYIVFTGSLFYLSQIIHASMVYLTTEEGAAFNTVMSLLGLDAVTNLF